MFFPVLIFSYIRLEHLKNLLRSLEDNPGFYESPLFFFCDYARQEADLDEMHKVRDYVDKYNHPLKKIIKSKYNKGLSASIIDGVGYVLKENKAVIVLEDDLVVSKSFIKYMNTALNYYSDDQIVMQVSGYNYPAGFSSDNDVFFLPLTTSWGWGTWSRAWSFMSIDEDGVKDRLNSLSWRYRFDLDFSYPSSYTLRSRLCGKNNSWAIFWYYTVFQLNGLVLYPKNSMVNNNGFDGSGTHCGDQEIERSIFIERPLTMVKDIYIDHVARKELIKYLYKSRGIIKILKNIFWSVLLVGRPA